MTTPSHVKAAEERFFSALVTHDGKTLKALLTDDFLIIDVMSGREVRKVELISFLESGQLEFKTIDPVSPAKIRLYGDAAIVTGETVLWVSFGGKDHKTKSHYTHVFVKEKGEWKLASAQGTPVRTPAEV